VTNLYKETVEACQFVKGHKAIMNCIDLVERGGFKDNWLLSSGSLKVGSDGLDGHIHYIVTDDWLVLGSDDVLRIFKTAEFERRFDRLPIPMPEKAVLATAEPG
jgi:hypothetical protein